MSEDTQAVEKLSDAAKDEQIQSEDLKTTLDTTEESGIDYKAELEKIRGERDNYKQGMLNAKAKLKEQKEVPEVPQTDEMESRLEKMLEAKLSEFQIASQASSINQEVSSLSSSSDEAELIKYHLENTIRLTGDTKADVRRAKLIANERTHQKQLKEMAAALNSKETVSGAQFSGQKSTVGNSRIFTEAEKKAARAFGVSLDKLTKK